jgi:hypothetical protein
MMAFTSDLDRNHGFVADGSSLAQNAAFFIQVLSHMYRNHAFLYISSLREACGRDGDARATLSSHHSSKVLTNKTTNKSIQYKCNTCVNC